MQTRVKDGLNRRQFLRSSSLAAIMSMMGGVSLHAQPEERFRSIGPSLNCAVIGCGVRGREILSVLSRLRNARVVAVCEHYPPFLRRAKEIAPHAEACEDYRKVLENTDVQAVCIATPTHQHKEIAIAALAAGKHVFCEAPMAHTIEDARAIAQAAKATPKCNFQIGLQKHSEEQSLYLHPFIRAGGAGEIIKVRAQWHNKQSWQRTAPSADREQELNWRLRRATSTGLVGEIGIHQIDLVNWYLDKLPLAVTGLGNTLIWKDGRDVPDTVHAVFEYPNDVLFNFEATLGNSFDAECTLFYGTFSGVLSRPGAIWMFKENDAPLLGWEVFRKKEQYYGNTGIAIKGRSRDRSVGDLDGITQATPDFYIFPSNLHEPLEAFIANTNTLRAGVADFTEAFGGNAPGLSEYLAQLRKDLHWFQAAGFKEGFQSAVTVLKANEAILNQKRIEYQPEWFEIKG